MFVRKINDGGVKRRDLQGFSFLTAHYGIASIILIMELCGLGIELIKFTKLFLISTASTARFWERDFLRQAAVPTVCNFRSCKFRKTF